MSKLTVIDAQRFEKLLFTLGFKMVRQKGSHVFYRHEDGRYTTLPLRSSEDISQDLLELEEESENLLKEIL